MDKQADQLKRYAEMVTNSNQIDPELYTKYQVMRGLRDLNGHGVLVGLTEIGDVNAHVMVDGVMQPAPGKLIYRGIDVEELAAGYMKENRPGFEETCYLLLFGDLPNRQQLTEFEQLMGSYRTLPEDFVRDIILKMPSKDIMNSLARSVLSLYSIDDRADDTDIANVMNQCLKLIAWFPSLAVYSYQALRHYHGGRSLVIHSPRKDLGAAANILHLMRTDSQYTEQEARLLDLALVLHAEHGGGNNSSFVTHVVTSAGSDTYSVMAAALGSLKGPRHGGANIKVIQMFEDMKQQVKDWNNDGEITDYLMKLLNKEAFDKAGLIYGLGHAVYSISDPRAILLRDEAEKLAAEKGFGEEFALYERVERLAPEVIAKVRRMYKGVSVNVDFYSGLVYRMLGIPEELFTPLFAISRVAGWSAHRMEEIANNGKIIRPAYKAVGQSRAFVPMLNR